MNTKIMNFFKENKRAIIIGVGCVLGGIAISVISKIGPEKYPLNDSELLEENIVNGYDDETTDEI
jgi:hypothetical protein